MIDFAEGIFSGKKVLITGHTGFKGSWMCILLRMMGAKVSGYALDPPTNPSLFNDAKVNKLVDSHIGDVRDLTHLVKVINKVQPEIVIHMAAQPLVRDSYKSPIETYDVNVIGTINLLEACRQSSSVKAIVNVTTDKCYENKEWYWSYREDEPLGGFDPYSSSKACSELITASYRNSYFNPNDYNQHRVAVATARAGNVIGGGDWASDRLIPDFFRSIQSGKVLRIRNPYAIRPWQHVLEPLSGYLLLAAKLYTHGPEYAEPWNFGPLDSDAKNVKWIVERICNLWGPSASYNLDKSSNPHEAKYLKLDCSKAKIKLKWEPKWNIENALASIVQWNKAYLSGNNMRQTTEDQILNYFNG